MKPYFQEIIENKKLSTNSAKEVLTIIGKGEAEPSQIAAFLGMYAMKGVLVEELEGFREAMLQLAVQIDLSEFDAMDVCGTGGDGKDTFNISTTSAFVVAGAGQKVAKHGNHGVSSAVGSSTVLEHLGIKFTNDVDFLKHKLETAGICYMHAPLFHPAMKYVAPIRKELGLKTFFNILGPLLNPAKVQKQLTGTFDLATAELYGKLFNRSNAQYTIIHSLDGYDEISLTGDFVVISNNKPLSSGRGEGATVATGEVKTISPISVGLPFLNAEDLHGGSTTTDAAEILLNILKNKATQPQTDVVVANAALALHAADSSLSISDAILKAEESLESGKAYEAFKKLIE
ncbi:MAG: anthranilate phosphoribosyltransferase [Spirosomataceae bacterium]